VCPPEVRFDGFIEEGTVYMIVIGADTHKRTHALAAVDGATGAVVGERTVEAREAGHLAALRWARELGDERVWAIEDCRHVSRRLEQALVVAGERVIRVAPRLMGESRRGERTPGKSDRIDALAVARAVLREGIERFPAAFLDEQAMEIRLLADHRDDVVAERTRAQNRLRWHLVDLCPALEASLPKRSLDRQIQLDRVARALRRLPGGARVRVALQLVSRIRALTREANALEAQLRALVRTHRPQLLAETGCGTLTAATLIGRTAGAERFATDARFARQTGTAPIPASSGNRTRHHLHRGGDRQLNRALHTIVLSRLAHHPETKRYAARRAAEGKTPREIKRCLKRHLARRLYRLLETAAVAGDTRPERTPRRPRARTIGPCS
jgi:transposase